MGIAFTGSMLEKHRCLPLLLAVLVALSGNVAWAEEAAPPRAVALNVPFRTQFDGSRSGPANCGPASLAMVLSSFGVGEQTLTIRQRADRLLGNTDPSEGTRLEDLATIAAQQGLVVTGPIDGVITTGKPRFRRWTLAEARAEVLAGRPMIIQVYYPLLPNHRTRPVDTDHYVVLVGLDGDGFLFNDPANKDFPGYRVPITAAELTKSWAASDFPFGGFSLAPQPGQPGLSLQPKSRETAPRRAMPQAGFLPRAS
ncbi:MAG: C39 family peptidase [Chloroflexota bacterium]